MENLLSMWSSLRLKMKRANIWREAQSANGTWAGGWTKGPEIFQDTSHLKGEESLIHTPLCCVSFWDFPKQPRGEERPQWL